MSAPYVTYSTVSNQRLQKVFENGVKVFFLLLPFPSDYKQCPLEVEGSGVIPALQSGSLARSVSSLMILILVVTEQIQFNLRMKKWSQTTLLDPWPRSSQSVDQFLLKNQLWEEIKYD